MKLLAKTNIILWLVSVELGEKMLIVFRPSDLQAVEINYCQCSVAGLNPNVLSEGKSSLYVVLYGIWVIDTE